MGNEDEAVVLGDRERTRGRRLQLVGIPFDDRNRLADPVEEVIFRILMATLNVFSNLYFSYAFIVAFGSHALIFQKICSDLALAEAVQPVCSSSKASVYVIGREE